MERTTDCWSLDCKDRVIDLFNINQKYKMARYSSSTCFCSSSTTSSNKSFGVEPEVFDATARYVGRSLT